MPTTPAGMAAYFHYLQEPRFPGSKARGVPGTVIEDATTGAWHSEYGSVDGDGGVPGLMEWVRMMEFAILKIVPPPDRLHIATRGAGHSPAFFMVGAWGKREF